MILKNNKGFLAADFMFSLVLATGMCILLFSVSYTLFTVEVTQYIAFSTARAHAAAHVDSDKQIEMAKNKFNELVNNPYLASLYKNGWFKISQPDIRGGEQNSTKPDFTDLYPEQLGSAGTKRVPQTGVRIELSVKLLELKLPFVGNTYEEQDQFKTNLTGLLFREPTMKECQDQLKRENRYKAILNLDQRFQKLGSLGDKDYSGSEINVYIPMEDNGC